MIRPRRPLINRNNPLTKGLVFDVPYFEGGGTTPLEIAGSRVGAWTNAPVWAKTLYGNAVTYADNTNLDTYTTQGPQDSFSQVSVEALIYPTAVNAAGDSRWIMKGANKTFDCAIITGNKFEFAVGFQTTEGDWDTPAVSTLNAWYHVVMTMDISSAANTPIIYVNATPQTLTVALGPVGTSPVDTSVVGLGNRPVAAGSQTKGFVGNIAYVRYWNRILNQQEVKQLYENPWRIYKPLGFPQALNSVAAAAANAVMRMMMGMGL